MYLDVSRKQKALEEFSNIERTDSERTESSDVETLNSSKFKFVIKIYETIYY